MSTNRFDVFDALCPSRSAFTEATGRWGALTLAALHASPRRFSELRRSIGGISDRMLSQTLQQLEADGLLTRTAHSHNVQYELTPLGVPVATKVTEFIEVLYQQLPEILLARSHAHSDVQQNKGENS